MNRKAVLAFLIAVSLIGLWFVIVADISEPISEPEGISIPALMPEDVRDSEIALKYGIKGYLEITLAQDSPSITVTEDGEATLTVKSGGEANITILLHFVSHTPELREAEVKIDPSGEEGHKIEQYYTGGLINVNDLVSYDPSGVITLRDGQTMPVTMSVRIPKGFPVSSFPLGAVGISTNIPVLDDVHVEVTVLVRA